MATATDTAQSPEQQAAQLVTAAELRGYERGKAEAAGVALTKRVAALALRAHAAALTTAAQQFGATVPTAATAFTSAANALKASATALGG